MGRVAGIERARRAVGAGLLCAWMGLASGQAVAELTAPCPGDCAGDGSVTIGDLVVGVNIALGLQPVSACSPMDSNDNGSVTVDDLVRAVSAALDGCPSSRTPTASQTPTATPTTAPPTPTVTPSPTVSSHFCDLPGSVVTTANGLVVVPGGPAGTPDLSFLQLPVGFCAHYYGHVGNARQLRFAPGGELFVASPTTFTTGNGPNGQAAIVVLPDDDHDGAADPQTTFLAGLPSTQGLLFANRSLYYQDHTKILRVPYTSGDRTPSGQSEQVANITVYNSILHWPKTLDIADDGTIYVGNGGDEGEPCITPHPFHGGILKLDGSPGGAQVAKGFRNPISVRCQRGHNRCYALELTRDYSTSQGGREKVVPIRQGDDWGFPCCATANVPFPDIMPVPDCTGVASESDSFIVGNTPFDLDYEYGRWPAPWDHRVYVPLHGAFGTWQGARVVAIEYDPATGEVLEGSTLPGGSSGALAEFASGWDDGTHAHGRPANVVFAPDGRLFLGNDFSGDIVWIAPVDL